MSTISLDPARKAQQEALSSIKEKFSFVNGTGLAFEHGVGYVVVIYLREKPPALHSLPSAITGVPVKYKMIGPVYSSG